MIFHSIIAFQSWWFPVTSGAYHFSCRLFRPGRTPPSLITMVDTGGFRTHDLLTASQAFYLLNYWPIYVCWAGWIWTTDLSRIRRVLYQTELQPIEIQVVTLVPGTNEITSFVQSHRYDQSLSGYSIRSGVGSITSNTLLAPISWSQLNETGEF